MKKKTRLLAFLLAMLLCGPCAFGSSGNVVFAAEASKQTVSKYWDLFTAKEFDAGEGFSETLKYRIYVPSNYDPERSYPLVLFLHGAGERGSDNKKQLTVGMMKHYCTEENMQKYPAIIIAPQCPENKQWVSVSWSQGDYDMEMYPETDYIKMASLLTDAITEQYSIDPDRRYVTGISMGGYGTWNIILNHPDQFSAALPICGAGDSSKADLIKDMPIWTFHGSKDTIVPVTGTRAMVDALEKAGSTGIQYTENPFLDHFCWDPAYSNPDTFAWLFGQVKTGSAVEKTDLEEKLEEAEAVDRTTLTEAQLATLEEAIAYTQELIEKDQITQHQVDQSLKLLARAIDGAGAAASGDVNGDGAVDSKDARLILQYSVGSVVLTDGQLQAANMNGDSDVDSKDARNVLQRAVEA